MRSIRTILAVLFLLQGGFALAQDLVLAVLSEKTVAGTQYGASLKYEAASRWATGVFYQTSLIADQETNKQMHTFFGCNLQAPLLRADQIYFNAHMRVGLADNKFFVLVPGLETRMNITRRTGIAFEMSLRMNYPSLTGKIFTRIF